MATPNSQVAAELWPLILKRLERWQRTVGTGGGGGGGTVTVEFTGAVTDDMAPQFILRDGSRSLQGNLAVDAGVTIDGVDISAHAADASAHHAPVTSGDGIGVTGQSVAVDSTVVRTSRTLTAGDGLGGGGDLSANRSFAVDSTVVRTSRTLTAGTGITGGGDLSANRSFAVNQAFTPTWTGVHTFNANPVIANNLSFTGARTINSNSTNALTLAPGGELVLDPGGTVTLGAGKELRTATFSDLLTGIAGARLWDLGSNSYQMTIGGLRADNLYARTFVADATRIDRGAEYWSKSFGVVETDFTLPAIASTVDVWFEDAPALTGDIFSVGDWLLIRTVEWGTSLTLSMVWFDITARVNASSGGRQRWRLRRQSGGTTGQTIKAQSVALDVGASGQGWIHLSALNQDAGPFLQMGTWAGANPYTPANVTNRVRMGHLSGVAGYGTGKWGFATGNNLGLTPATGFSGIVTDATDGAKLYNTDIELRNGASLTVKIDRVRGISMLQDSGQFIDSQRAMKWYADLSSPTTVKTLLVSWTNTTDLPGDYFFITPAWTGRGSNTPYLYMVANSPSEGNTLSIHAGSIVGISSALTQISGNARISGLTGINVDPSSAAQLAVVTGAAARPAIVARAAASQTAAIQEWQDSSGTRIGRVGATGGFQSSFVVIADDDAATIYADAVSGVLVIWLTGTTAGAQAGAVVLVRSGQTGPHAVLLANGTAVEVTTSDVSGTTGTDGKYTISATATALKIENRLGGTRTFNWFRIS